MLFFYNINTTKIEWLSLITTFILSLIVLVPMIIMYYNKLPFKLVIADDKLIIYKLFKKDIICITEVLSISELNPLNAIVSPITYIIKYENRTIYLNTEGYKNLNKFISILKEKSGCRYIRRGL
jgi:hypothetical protein